jgi:hypothetical protein
MTRLPHVRKTKALCKNYLQSYFQIAQNQSKMAAGHLMYALEIRKNNPLNFYIEI